MGLRPHRVHFHTRVDGTSRDILEYGCWELSHESADGERLLLALEGFKGTDTVRGPGRKNMFHFAGLCRSSRCRQGSCLVRNCGRSSIRSGVITFCNGAGSDVAVHYLVAAIGAASGAPATLPTVRPNTPNSRNSLPI